MSLSRNTWITLAIALAVFATVTAIGAITVSRNEISREYFPRFSPALSFACGGPFGNILFPRDEDGEFIDPRSAGVTPFLAVDEQSFDCDEYPEEFESRVLSAYQGMHQYSMYLVGGIWRIFGVSWSSISPVFVLMFGLTGLFSFLIAMRFMSRWAAAIVALTFITSSSVMSMLPLFRDFSRAPFVMLAIAIMAFMLVGRRSLRVILLSSAAVGLVAGTGLGFRTDALALAPLFAATSIILLPGPWKTWSPLRLLPLGVFLVVFVVSSFPVLRA